MKTKIALVSAISKVGLMILLMLFFMNSTCMPVKHVVDSAPDQSIKGPLLDGPSHSISKLRLQDLLSYENPSLQAILDSADIAQKPIIIYFTGHACVNSKKLEEIIFNDVIIKNLYEDFVFVTLYADDRTVLPEAEWYVSPHRDKEIKRKGARNVDLQQRLFKTNAQPYFFMLNTDGSLVYSIDAHEAFNSFEGRIRHGITLLDSSH